MCLPLTCSWTWAIQSSSSLPQCLEYGFCLLPTFHEAASRTQPWDCNVVLGPFALFKWLDPVKDSIKYFKIWRAGADSLVWGWPSADLTVHLLVWSGLPLLWSLPVLSSSIAGFRIHLESFGGACRLDMIISSSSHRGRTVQEFQQRARDSCSHHDNGLAHFHGLFLSVFSGFQCPQRRMWLVWCVTALEQALPAETALAMGVQFPEGDQVRVQPWETGNTPSLPNSRQVPTLLWKDGVSTHCSRESKSHVIPLECATVDVIVKPGKVSVVHNSVGVQTAHYKDII